MYASLNASLQSCELGTVGLLVAESVGFVADQHVADGKLTVEHTALEGGSIHRWKHSEPEDQDRQRPAVRQPRVQKIHADIGPEARVHLEEHTRAERAHRALPWNAKREYV